MEMERKTISVSAVLLMILLASFAFVPATSAQGSEEHHYTVMGGYVHGATQLGVFPASDLDIPILPMLMGQNINFSARDPVTGIVDLIVPAGSYVGVVYTWYDDTSLIWYTINVTMTEDGYGWLFTGNGTNPILGDVDCYTFNNDTGSYWLAPSPLVGQLAALSGDLPSPGPDGIAGTADDGFGDGTPDAIGSSILFLPSTLNCTYWDDFTNEWKVLFVAPWPQVFTTGIAYDIVIEPASQIDGSSSTEEGDPWEYLAGLDNPGKGPVPHGHPKWNAYVTYVCAWSVLEIDTPLGYLDVFFEIVEKKVRSDLIIADVNCDEVVNIVDVVIAAVGYGSRDQNVGPDGEPETHDDKKHADPNYDARGDVADPRQIINIVDIVRIAIDYDKKLLP